MARKVYPDWLPRVTLGERIAGLRAMRGWSLRDLAKASGVSAATLSRVERGHDMQLSHLVAIAKGFGLAPDELLRGVDIETKG